MARVGLFANMTKRWHMSALVPLVLLALGICLSGCAGLVAGNASSTAAPVAPTIATQPANQSVTAGQTASFSVVATGTAPLIYQWKKNGSAISGATAASYTTPATTTSDSGSSFTVVVSNSAGSVTSNAATLTVNPATVAPTITSQPVSQGVIVGQTATFTVVATGTAPLSYQWKKNGTNIAGATSSSYTTPATTNADNGSQFTVVVSNAAGNATSNTATLTVTASAVAPSITTQPANQTVTAGQTATFSVVATGTAPLSYQWKKNGTAISGATAASYTTPATTSSDSGSSFTVVVSNSAGSATSNAATLTVNAATVAPTITTQPASQTVAAGQTATFSVVATGTAPLSYQWKKNGTAISGATGASYTTPATTTSDSGSSFTVVVSNSAGSVTSNAATLTVSSGGGIPGALGWYEIPNTQLRPLCPPYSDIQASTGCPAVMSAWNGGLFDTQRNRLIVHGGGHTDYFGNEVYALDLNANPIHWLLVHDASHGSAINNVTSCPDSAYLDGNPNAVHDYSGMAYLAKADAYLRQGGSLANCGFFTDSTWVYNPTTNSWSNPTTQPPSNGSPATVAYDPTTGDAYESTHNTGIFWQYDPAAQKWTNLGNSMACTNGQPNTAAIDDSRRAYYCVGSGDFEKVSLNSPYTMTDLSKASGCSALVSAQAPGFVYDPVQKLMVGWVGGNTVYLYNPDTNSCSTQSFPSNGACPTAAQSNGTYGRFQYSPALGVFVLANSIDANVCTLRLTSGSGATPESDFQARCSAAGVLRCVGWDSASDFSPATGGGGYATGLYPAEDGSYEGVQDTSTSVSGGSSLKFVIRPGSVHPHGTDPAGYYLVQFGPDGNAHKFGEGSDLYLQFRYRLDPQLLNYDWTQAGGEGWKVFIVWGPVPGPSCTDDQFVQENTFQRNIATGYTSCGQPELSDFSQSPQLLEQGDYNCPYSGNPGNYTNPPCFVYPANTWITEYWHVHIGTWGSANSLFEAWVAPQGQALKQFIKLPNFTFGNSADHTVGLQAIQFTPYFSGANNSTTTPGSAMWFDEFIVSTQPIAAPKF